VTAANIEILLFNARNAPFTWSRHLRSYETVSLMKSESTNPLKNRKSVVS
jgi:hypothetical protein